MHACGYDTVDRSHAHAETGFVETGGGAMEEVDDYVERMRRRAEARHRLHAAQQAAKAAGTAPPTSIAVNQQQGTSIHMAQAGTVTGGSHAANGIAPTLAAAAQVPLPGADQQHRRASAVLLAAAQVPLPAPSDGLRQAPVGGSRPSGLEGPIRSGLAGTLGPDRGIGRPVAGRNSQHAAGTAGTSALMARKGSSSGGGRGGDAELVAMLEQAQVGPCAVLAVGILVKFMTWPMRASIVCELLEWNQ